MSTDSKGWGRNTSILLVAFIAEHEYWIALFATVISDSLLSVILLLVATIQCIKNLAHVQMTEDHPSGEVLLKHRVQLFSSQLPLR
jgi:hypothetical protein